MAPTAMTFKRSEQLVATLGRLSKRAEAEPKAERVAYLIVKRLKRDWHTQQLAAVQDWFRYRPIQ